MIARSKYTKKGYKNNTYPMKCNLRRIDSHPEAYSIQKEKSKQNIMLAFHLFVTPQGFKPRTAGAEIQCSIQLS